MPQNETTSLMKPPKVEVGAGEHVSQLDLGFVKKSQAAKLAGQSGKEEVEGSE